MIHKAVIFVAQARQRLKLFHIKQTIHYAIITHMNAGHFPEDGKIRRPGQRDDLCHLTFETGGRAGNAKP